MRTAWLLASLICMGTLHAETLTQESSPRLKFKRGPVCMCSTGLTEADIRAAQKGWELPGQSPGASPPPSTEENRPPKKKEE